MNLKAFKSHKSRYRLENPERDPKIRKGFSAPFSVFETINKRKDVRFLVSFAERYRKIKEGTAAAERVCIGGFATAILRTLCNVVFYQILWYTI